MKTIRATVALLVVAGALPAVQAQGIPSVEACIRYAEADAAFEAAMQQAEAAVEAVKQPAEQALVTAYSASYDIDGGARSDVPDVMMKLLDHRRQRCRELHGL